MIQVIADATLLRYLIEIEVVDVLPVLFGQIMAPPAVIHDLQHINTPAPIRTWIASLPPWVVVHAPRSTTDPDLGRVGAGEREAILLAHEYQPALLVTDDRRARRIAEARGLRVVGTVWVLERDAAGVPIKLYLFTRTRSTDEPKVIAMDPYVSFGRPVLAGTGIPTAIIAERYRAGESIEELARDYECPPHGIEEALQCELTTTAA